jgi:hypothetical protein
MLILFLGCHTVQMWEMFLTSEVHAASIFRVKVCIVGEFLCIPRILF